MPIPAHPEKSCTPKGRSVSLPVVTSPRNVRRSKMGPRRAAVLIAVHVLMIAHVAQWYFSGKGRTLSPIEPSETMYTLEQGQLNAGFVFFALALLATAIVGRFVCGWGCHLVALQDTCGWLMKKCGVHPKPFKSRLLVWAPLVLALYMFVKPTFVREVVQPLAGDRWSAIAPYVGYAAPRPKLTPAFTKTEFWETFAGWTAAVPFLLVCGFGAVYFLGAKGFCTYGCPYGGFFAPLDALSPGRIRVTDACNHCGHCTAACSSNVRVHEEVRDYGMITDPGCMKCLDCVDVCPNDALYFGFGKPAILAGARALKPSKPRFGQRTYDLSLLQEAFLGALFVALFMCYRGMLEQVPLLMAMAMAGIGVFLTWKSLSLLATPSVRLQSLQLKLKGRLRPAGLAFAALTALMLGAAAWSGTVRYNLWKGGLLFDRLSTPAETVFSLEYAAPAGDRELAQAALAHYRRADTPSYGGFGWRQPVQFYSNSGYLSAMLGDYAAAETYLRRAIDRSGPRGPGFQITFALGRAIGLQKRPIEDAIGAYETLLAARPQFTDAALVIGKLEIFRGNGDAAADRARAAVAARPTDPSTLSNAAQIMVDSNHLPDAADYLKRYLDIDPANQQNRRALAAVLVNIATPQALESALAQYKFLADAGGRDPNIYHAMAALLNELGRPQEAQEMEQKAAAIEQPK